MSVIIKSMDQNKTGIWFGIAAYTSWGVLPLYWKLLQTIPALELLAHRILWSFVFVILIVVITVGWKSLSSVLTNKKKLFLIFCCGFIISVNWFVYIFAVTTNHVIEASMGYFINPLVVVLLGVMVFKEKLSRWQLAALILAASGVLVIAVQYGRIPWIALFLAGTFALYGLIKKMIKIDPIAGLVLETLIVLPIALFFIINLETGGAGTLNLAPIQTKIILAGTGIITAIPLFLYAKGIENTTFSMMGFLQYIAPSIKLFLGVVIFKEYFSFYHFLSFCLIWAALAIFTLANLGILKEPIMPRADEISKIKASQRI